MNAYEISTLAALLFVAGCSSSSPPANGGMGGASGAHSTGSGGAGESSVGDQDAGGMQDAGAPNLQFILGPETDNQQPIVVGAEHSGFFGNTPLFAMDSSGNVFTVDESNSRHTLYKYDSSLSAEPLWSDDRVLPHPISVARDGGVVIRRQTDGATGITGARLAKLSPDGLLLWEQQASGCLATAVAADGSIYATGLSDNGPWIARYDEDGNEVFFENYPDFVAPTTMYWAVPYDIFVDAENNITAFDPKHAIKIDSAGNELSRTETTITFDDFSKLMPIVTNPATDAFYSWTRFSDRDEAFGKYSLDRTLLSHRLIEPVRYVDVGGGLFWQGEMKVQELLAKTLVVGEDSVYLSGGYLNTVGDVTTARTTKESSLIFVGRYDLEGNRIWFQELLLEGNEPVVNPTTMVATEGLGQALLGLALDPDGNPTIEMSTHDPLVVASDFTTYIFKLSRDDGSLLPVEN